MMHLLKGHYKHELRPDIVLQILQVVKNGKEIQDVVQNKKTHQPLSIKIVAKLKEAIKNSRIPIWKKRLNWFVATACMPGSFRIL